MNRRNSTCQVLIPLASHSETGLLDHVSELLLAGEPLDAFDKILVAITVSGDQLADEGNGTERPLLVDGVEERVLVHLAELEASKHAAWLQDPVSLPQSRRDIGEVSDAECDSVQVERVVLDGLR